MWLAEVVFFYIKILCFVCVVQCSKQIWHKYGEISVQIVNFKYVD